ncbi:S26 family signal peptidase [Nonomuraea sp. NPDC046802]|uniref:S26 family signal peptidase n=1 Tax=Nonomuraea sp. NPDC046802 TaxID=3154919 RepID=UPI0033C57A1D
MPTGDKPLDERYLAGNVQAPFTPVTVPTGHIRVQGDNRPVSLDSRNHHRANRTGPVPASSVMAILE